MPENSQSPEKTKAAELAKQADSMDLSQIKERIKKDLLSLNQIYEQFDKSDRNVKDRLASAETLLNSLRKRFPNDPDILLLGKTYEDLKGDFDRGAAIEIDTAYKRIFSEMVQVLKDAGVRKEYPDEKGIAGKTVAKLKSLGIEPEYVTTCGNSKAKTVVLFMQAHPQSGMSQEQVDVMGYPEPQARIEFAINKIVESGLSKEIYDEGLEMDEEVASGDLKRLSREDPQLQISAAWRSKEKYGDKVRLKGYESYELFPHYLPKIPPLLFLIQSGKLKERNMTPEQKTLLTRFVEFGENRMTSGNVYLASNVKASLEKSDQAISLMILGGDHENPTCQPYKKENPLPISQALAYYGLNVIVVDYSGELKVPIRTDRVKSPPKSFGDMWRR